MTSNPSPPHRSLHRICVVALLLHALLAPSVLLAQEAAGTEQKEEPALSDAPSTAFLKIGGYAETYYSWNFAKPENGITNNRWLDEKHNTFTLATVGLDVTAQKGPFYGRLSLMFGPTADRWYFEGVRTSEEGVVLSPAGYHNETWKHLQIAYVGYTAPVGAGLTIYGGLFPTQVGYEGAAVKDNWNWSRSNLFNFLPFFHVGARVAYPLTKTFTLTGAVYNGYNQMTDLNGKKTLSLHGSLVLDKFFLNIMYMGGDETVKKDGRAPWRNMIDLVAQYDVHPRLSLALHGDTGFEKGDHMWAAGAFYARVKAVDWLYLAGRWDGIYEKVPGKDPANSILILGADHVFSMTYTLELRPVGDGFSLRLEYRYDDSDRHQPLYFKRGFNADGSQRASATQNTLTVGITGWF